jgi:hypothetical protein
MPTRMCRRRWCGLNGRSRADSLKNKKDQQGELLVLMEFLATPTGVDREPRDDD